VNNQIWGMLNATEQQLLRKVEPSALARLDEDGLAELHDRVRRARTKYSKLYRRRAGAQVGRDATRAHAHEQHARTVAKAEAFEDALATVSRQLAKAAQASARELRAERLAAARGAGKPGAKKPTKKRAAAKKGASRPTQQKRKTPAKKRARASTRATNARRQAKRDSR
jgi:hypothetical protein